MKKKLPIIIGLIWLAVTAVLYVGFVWSGQPDGVYTYDNDGCTVDQKVYVTDNEKNDGVIYEMNLYGKVTDYFSTKELQEQAYIRKLTPYSGMLYAVMEVPKSSEKDAQSAYVILEFENGLNLVRMTPALSFYEADLLTDLVADENGLYIATVTADGTAASVYTVLQKQLIDPETAMQSKLELESSLRQEAEAGRKIVAASYDMGSISIRTDADLVSGPFEPDSSIRYTYSMVHMNLGQLMSLHGEYRIYWFISVLAGWLLIFLFYLLLRNHNRVVYIAMTVETALLVLVVGSVGTNIINQKQTKQQAQTKWLSSVLSDTLGNVTTDAGGSDNLPFADDNFYTSETYTDVYNRLRMAYEHTKNDGCKDLFFTAVSDLDICVSASGRNHETFDNRYFKFGSDEAKKMIVPGTIVSTYVTLDGTSYQILAATAANTNSSGYALVGVFENRWLDYEKLQSQLVMALIIFALASLGCILILFLQSADLNRLARSMQLVASGRTDVERPRVHGGDMRAIWSALGEIQKKIRTANYTKFLTFEAYYRFAPKNIERLLNKDSITEVSSGDVAKLHGTMALISTVGAKNGSEQEIERLNRLLALIGRYQEEKDGVFVSNDGSLSILRFLYMEKNSSTLNSSVDFLKQLQEQENGRMAQTSILLHYSSFVYGVAGTNQQSSAFLVSRDTDEIERFAAWFRERNLRLVISETVKEREHYEGVLRCIGYIQMASSGKKMNMYEVLDAYDVRERERKRAICERFAQALELFYQHDFYLARSAFSDILKELPSDEISKWYLFTCESYLNMEYVEDVSCALRYEE